MNNTNGDAHESSSSVLDENNSIDTHMNGNHDGQLFQLQQRIDELENIVAQLKHMLLETLKRVNILEANSDRQTVRKSKSPVKSDRLSVNNSEPHRKVSLPTSHILKINTVDLQSKQQQQQRTKSCLPISSTKTPSKCSSRESISSVTGTGSQPLILLTKSATTSKKIQHHHPISPAYNNDTKCIRFNHNARSTSLYVPSSFDEDAKHLDIPNPLPGEILKLEWVYGYRGKDCRSNLYEIATGELIYFTASIVVLYNSEEHSQRHYLEHTDDIKSLCIHPDQVTVASGQSSSANNTTSNSQLAHIRIWDSISLHTTRIIGIGQFNVAVSCLSFSKGDSGKSLCAVDEGLERTLSIWNVGSGTQLTSTKCHSGPVAMAEFHSSDPHMIVTCGKQHIDSWRYDSNELKKISGLFGKDTPKFIVCIAFCANGDVCSGDSEGNILIWSKREFKLNRTIKNAHDGSIYCILVLEDTILTGGGKDGMIIEWNTNFEKTTQTYKLNDSMGCVRTIASSRGPMVAIGTTKNLILHGSISVGFSTIVDNHHDELCGLAIHPSEKKFLTCGNDGLIFYWDTLTHSFLWRYSLDEPIHCTAFHPSIDVVAIGLKKPKWLIFDCIQHKILHSQNEGTDQIQCLQYSPDGTYLAVGSGDHCIYVYPCENGLKYSKCSRLIGHSSFITHMDWSKNGQYLRSNSGDYDLIHWEILSYKQVSQPDTVRDIEWATCNCTLSYTTYGIYNDGANIGCCSRSFNEKLLICGDDNCRVNLLSYPCNKPKAARHSFCGHGGPLTNVAFVPDDDTRAISTGGIDATILQWTVELS